MFISLILKRIAAWRRYRNNLRELGQLTDRELEDIGLGIFDITGTEYGSHAFGIR